VPQEFKITAKRNKLSVRYGYIIFPFFTGELLETLTKTKMDYVVSPPPKTPPVPMGQSIDWSGRVAKKGNVFLDFDSISQLIGVEGNEPIESVNVFFEVLDIVKASLEPKLDDHAQFYELISSYSIETGESPLERLGKINQSGLCEKVKEIIKEPVSTYGFHICTSTKKIEDADWFDIHIQPTTRRWNTTFDVMTVYRSKDKSKVDKFTKNYDDYIRKIFDELNKV